MLPESALASLRRATGSRSSSPPKGTSRGAHTSDLRLSIVTCRSHLSEIFHVAELAGHPTGSRHCLFAWFLPVVRTFHVQEIIKKIAVQLNKKRIIKIVICRRGEIEN
ncbi:hypothetical protein PUN28_015660 [Cardiocondyla obscurior]|uniref:Uncharacterized protein n=1 Tax=Cardiocondyla obscurior TaxID=286306 RepID=A0AAW2EXD9_9HYME